MNDNEKLIEEARRWPRGRGVIPSAAPGELIPRLADVLEAAEKARTATGDERGMSVHLRKYQDQAARLCGCSSCLEWLAESARRSEVSEPAWETATDRRFGLTEFVFRDYRSTPFRTFSVQRSSIATEHKVWIGVESDRAHLNVDEATRVRDALNAFIAEAEREGAWADDSDSA